MPVATGRADAERVRRWPPKAVRAAPPPQGPPRPADLLLDGLAARVIDGPAAGMPAIGRALDAFRGPDLDEDKGPRWLWPAGAVAVGVWDYATWDLLSDRQVWLARTSGQVTDLPLALTARVCALAFAGDLTTAAALADEVRTVSEAIGASMPLYGVLLVAAFQGDRAPDDELFRTAEAEAARRGEGGGVTISHWSRAMLANGHGRYKEASAAAERAARHATVGIGPAIWALAEGVEAAARGGTPRLGDAALGRLTEATRPSGTDWALGIEARCRALVNEERPAADQHYQEAIDLLGRTPLRVESHGRTFSTASGCAAGITGAPRAGTCAPPTTCSPPWACSRSPGGRRANCGAPVRARAGAPPRPRAS
ncbi:hypothetical protein [Actinomadura sp. SCN-SB]|uniref:hypothetical protein n=1 Tax=Actinomadura sp. SCN-SB TaxID=3373092 RepID=UPI0037512F24